KKAVSFGVPWPGAVLGQNLDCYFARVTVHWAAHLARTSERCQTSLPLFVCFLSERPKFSLRHRLMGHAIQHCPAGNSAHVERKVPRVIREGRDLLHRFTKLHDRIRPMTVLAAG